MLGVIDNEWFSWYTLATNSGVTAIAWVKVKVSQEKKQPKQKISYHTSALPCMILLVCSDFKGWLLITIFSAISVSVFFSCVECVVYNTWTFLESYYADQVPLFCSGNATGNAWLVHLHLVDRLCLRILSQTYMGKGSLLFTQAYMSNRLQLFQIKAFSYFWVEKMLMYQ